MSIKTIFDLEPNEKSSLNDWVIWSERLKMRINGLEQRNVKIKQSEAKLKRDIRAKDKAFRFYKKQITELENEILNIENDKYYKIAKFIKSAIHLSIIGLKKKRNTNKFINIFLYHLISFLK